MVNNKKVEGKRKDSTSRLKIGSHNRLKEVNALKENLRIIQLAKTKAWSTYSASDLRKVLKLKHVVCHRASTKDELIAMAKKYCG